MGSNATWLTAIRHYALSLHSIRIPTGIENVVDDNEVIHDAIDDLEVPYDHPSMAQVHQSQFGLELSSAGIATQPSDLPSHQTLEVPQVSQLIEGGQLMDGALQAFLPLR